ncbi:FAD/NAD(P)-binding domain-containing protein [Pholiota conissans]|uniref:FAD/NAD(P)-binding domain-containing protein n=1 Tax=Pholiota conissans TaxID=109636 RepID=A0A9P6CQS5_9AGAR|nr:FAD/NAD(P)-binding domain-containing protein [Pholiota conissans]
MDDPIGCRERILSEPVGILGAGVAGLINAYVLLQDGFTNITVITRDRSVGGTWSRDRVYPGLRINNVHGEYRFSALKMAPPEDAAETGGHITGMGMCEYMETFYSNFLENKATFKFETEIRRLFRNQDGLWIVNVEDMRTGKSESLNFNRVILCTGGCSNPKFPDELSPDTAGKYQFPGIVIHSSQFRSRLNDILSKVGSRNLNETGTKEGTILVVGGGKSAMDICAKLANEGRRVVNIFESPDRFLASKSAIPDFIRKSRFLSILSPHIVLRSRLERFLHTTTIGSYITHFIWNKLAETSLDAYSIPKDSPFRSPFSLFWGIRSNDEGRVRAGSYYSLVNTGQIEVISPARALGFTDDGKSVRLSNGTNVLAQVIILATGWQSSWTGLFDEQTSTELGIGRHAPLSVLKGVDHIWNYKTLANPPAAHPDNIAQNWVTSVYRGIVPGKNILRRDFAIAGAMFSSNVGYMTEVCAHWTSSYFQGDPMRLPSSPEEAIKEGELSAAWMRRRYPNMLSWINESYSTTLDFWTWPQAADELLEDMHVRSLRSGGNWLTWPFHIIDLSELSTLGDERRAVRENRKL